MIASEFRVFISALSGEFGKVRSAVASDLRSRELLVIVQEDFRLGLGADTLLRRLHDYIRDCSAVVCIIGDRSGTGPMPIETAPFAHLLPSGVTQASYTQWEFFIARHFKREPYLYNRFREAEPLMRRGVAILVEFTRRTGHRHPNLDSAISNYANLLKAMGKSLSSIDAAISTLERPISF
jgi:hypothetical protein